MRCETARRWFSRARDRELSRRQRRQLAAHLRRCDGCRKEYRWFRRTCGLLQEADPVRDAGMPHHLVDALMMRLRLEMSAATIHPRIFRADARVALAIAATLALLLWGDRLHVLDELPEHAGLQVTRGDR